MSNEEKIYNAVAAVFEGDPIEVIDVRGDQNHFKIVIQSQKFEGLNRVMQQKLVYKALGNLTDEIHAFQFDLSIPST